MTVNQYAHDLTFTLAAAPATGDVPASVEIDSIQIGNDATATASVQKIATNNGGVFLRAPTPDQLISAILSDINNTGTTTANFTVADQTTGQTTMDNGQPYSGPVAGLQWQYINITPDNLNITANAPNVFIHSGSGSDALDVSKVNGNSVLDGSTGSNFLVGGSGNDTFFVDDRGATADIWTTVAHFHSGDAATIWGITPQDFQLSWVDNQGAAGFQGLTLHATALTKLTTGSVPPPPASLTLAGYTTTDLNNGRLSVSFGADPASGSSYMYVHGNS